MPAAAVVVDHQAHWYPRAVFEAETREPDPRAQRDGDGYVFTARPGGYQARIPARYVELDLQLESMDRHGIDTAVVSANLLGDVAGVEAARAQHLVELANHEIATAQRAHPGRIVGLAMLPLEHPARALDTLNRAILDEGLRGVCLLSNVLRGPIVSDELQAIYARIEELGVPIFLHPRNESSAAGRGLLDIVDVGAGWMFDTTAAALTLIYSGLLDRHPGLTIVHPHLGGTLPFLRGRIPECYPPPVEHELEWYLRNRFYVDSATDTANTMALAIDSYGAERIVFATDWPWFEHGHGWDLLRCHDGGAHVDTVLANRVPALRLGGDT